MLDVRCSMARLEDCQTSFNEDIAWCVLWVQ